VVLADASCGLESSGGKQRRSEQLFAGSQLASDAAVTAG
jgi:hypothetical protein